ncbi:tetratricopeptide repeat protein [Streptomyces sp. AF1A]|uniref:tetratricopeptide repeat protein n=1 Tax=Streptomyces sp. AF1A TaxID=3394350 RepID=UPI0039BCB2D7
MERVRALLALPSTRDGEALPAVADVDAYGELAGSRGLYSHGTIVPLPHPPWLRRQLDDALGERSIVLLAGPNRAAKWRAGFEAVCRTLPGARLLVPRLETGALAELVDLQPPLPGDDGTLVVWLEGIERYLAAPDALGGDRLERLLKLGRRVVLMATVSGNLWEIMRTSQGVSRALARQVLDAAVTIEVPEPRGNGAEEETPPATAADFAHTDDEAAPLPLEAAALERRYRDGYLGGQAGWQVVKAAVDRRRAGLSRAATEPELRELVAACVPYEEPTDDAWVEALDWALAGPEGAALLSEQPRAKTAAPRTFQPHPHIVAHADAPTAPLPADIPAAAWEFVLRRSDAFELMQVAATAGERGHAKVAQQAWERAASSLEPMVVSAAGLFCRSEAGVRRRDGRTPGGTGRVPGGPARRSGGSRAIDGEWVFAAAQRSNQAQEMAERGDRDGAVRLYRQVLAEDDPIGTPLAGLNLGMILRDEGDLAGARSAYERALTCCTAHGDPTGMHGEVAGRLGTVLADLGERRAAQRMFEVAVDSGHRHAKPRALMWLGDLKHEDGDIAGAVAAYRGAIDAEDPALAAAARFKLALQIQDTDPEEALTHYRHVAGTTAVPDVVTAAAELRAGRILLSRGDTAGAREAYQRAAACAESEPAVWASLELGALLAQSGELTAAAAALQDAADSGHPEAAPLAAQALAHTRRQLGDLRGALQACRTVTHNKTGPRVAQVLLLQGDIHLQLREGKEAAAAYGRAMAHGDEPTMRLARERLRMIGFGGDD